MWVFDQQFPVGTFIIVVIIIILFLFYSLFCCQLSNSNIVHWSMSCCSRYSVEILYLAVLKKCSFSHWKWWASREEIKNMFILCYVTLVGNETEVKCLLSIFTRFIHSRAGILVHSSMQIFSRHDPRGCLETGLSTPDPLLLSCLGSVFGVIVILDTPTTRHIQFSDWGTFLAKRLHISVLEHP